MWTLPPRSGNIKQNWVGRVSVRSASHGGCPARPVARGRAPDGEGAGAEAACLLRLIGVYYHPSGRRAHGSAGQSGTGGGSRSSLERRPLWPDFATRYLVALTFIGLPRAGHVFGLRQFGPPPK